MNHPLESLADRVLTEIDTALRVIAAPAADRPPAPDDSLDEAARRESAALMRVNHAGEVAAQALYRGQAAVARDDALRRDFLRAADEEHAHLAWCEARVAALGERTSRLGAAWYAGSFLVGALAGLAGDRWSLGFLAETERQVAAHLDGHLARLPAEDTASRSIVTRMRAEEIAHAEGAERRGGAPLPGPARVLMRAAARVMTTVAYRV